MDRKPREIWFIAAGQWLGPGTVWPVHWKGWLVFVACIGSALAGRLLTEGWIGYVLMAIPLAVFFVLYWRHSD